MPADPARAMVDDNVVRAAAGITMVLGAVAFVFAYFRQQYWPLQLVSVFFAAEFLARLAVGIVRSPVGVVAGRLTRRQVPEWVSAKPKRFAWSLGLVMSGAMAVITNSGIRGWLPRTICLICLTLMWLESVLAVCLGCEIHGLLVRRGRVTTDDGYEICAHGACDVRPAGFRVPQPRATGPGELLGTTHHRRRFTGSQTQSASFRSDDVKRSVQR